MIDSKVHLHSCISSGSGLIVAGEQEFLRPIVTPFELELALTSKDWTGDYVLDFTTLLSSSTFGQTHVNLDKDEEDEEGPTYSSITGKYRHPKRYQQNGVSGSSCLLLPR
jgi:diphthamide biosynthesis protein 2